MTRLRRYRKAAAAAAGGVLQLLAVTTLPDSWAPWVQLVGAIATVVLVVASPANSPKPDGPAHARPMGGQLGG